MSPSKEKLDSASTASTATGTSKRSSKSKSTTNTSVNQVQPKPVPTTVVEDIKPKPVVEDTKPTKQQQQQQQPVDSVLQYTPLQEIPHGVQKLTDSFHKLQKTHSIQFRLNQLRNLYFALKDNIDNIALALEQDFGRSPAETKNLEVYPSLNELVFTMANLQKWSKREPVTNVPLNLKTNPVYIEKIPLGVVLIITPFNYPLFLSIPSIVGALAAGNCVVFKPSELTPHFSALLTSILNSALDPDIFYSVNGAIDETTTLLNSKFDKIMYTGNNMVGTIIAKKAAETLTPVLLELGGKSPAFVLQDVTDKDIATIANRISWGRFTNGGQTCVAVDYVLVHRSKHAKLIDALVKVTSDQFYPNLSKSDKSYTHIIHDRAYENLVKIIATTNGNVVLGGEPDKPSRFLPPTIIDNVQWDDSTMKQEIFGPILPVIVYDDLSQTLATIVSGPDTPLAQYIFTSGNVNRAKNHELNQILTTIRSGGTIVNDVLLHVGLANAPFGGVGNSGHGAYHGIYSFRAFSHERTTIEQKLWNEFMLKVRYPPFTPEKNRVLQSALTDYNGNVWFNRTGDVRINGPSSLFNVWTGIAGVAALAYAFSGVL